MVLHLLGVASIALGAACCYTASDIIEQRKASEAPPETSLKIALLWHLAKEPLWWIGIAADLGGFVLQTIALGLGSLVFVQPLLMLSLPITLVVGHRVGSHTLTRRDVEWAFIFVIALSAFLVIGDPSGGIDQRPFGDWLVPLAIVAVLTICVLAGSHRLPPARRALTLGLAAGMLFGVSATLMKSFAHLVARDGLGMLRHWEPYVMGGTLALGFLVIQSAFQIGNLKSALPALDLAEPVTASIFGFAFLHEELASTNIAWTFVLAVSVLVMVLSTVRLARAAARSDKLDHQGQRVVG